MDLQHSALQLAAAAEPSRLRLLVALLGGETTVGDLVSVLDQSQPRVSRHLRLLAEAGLVESFREGRSIYYRWSVAGLKAGLLSLVEALAANSDATLARDRERLQKLSRQRERDGLRRVLRAGGARGLHGADADAALADLLLTALGGTPGSRRLGDVLHVGCGSGELLRLLLPEAKSAVGTEPSGPRRQVARSRLRLAGLPHWTVREAVPAKLPFSADSFDLVILQDVLGPGAELPKILGEAARVLQLTGQLLIQDRILPTDGALAAPLAALGFAVSRRQWLPGRTPDRALILATRPEVDVRRTGTND